MVRLGVRYTGYPYKQARLISIRSWPFPLNNENMDDMYLYMFFWDDGFSETCLVNQSQVKVYPSFFRTVKEDRVPYMLRNV